MRIALVAPFGLRAKGTARARALPLGRVLAGRGHTVALFVPPYDSVEDSGRQWREEVGSGGSVRSPATAGSEVVARSGDRLQQGNGVDVINITLPPGRQGAGWHLRLGWRLFLAVRGWRPDVVHVFKPKGPSGLVGALLWLSRRGKPWCALSGAWAASRRPRLIVDSDDWEGPGGWNDDPRAGYSPAQRRFFAWQEHYGLSHADAWTVTSECLRQRAIAFGAAPDRVFVMHNGVAAAGGQESGVRSQESGVSGQESAVSGQQSQIANQKSKIKNQKSAVLYTRFAGVRAADVAAVWSLVREQLPEARLVVVGRGLAGEETKLVGRPGIEVRGWVEPAELPGVLAGATLAIAPWADTPSNRARHSAKIMELMAAGLPVVATAVGELPATLGEAGVLVPPGDTAAFAAAVAALLADPERAAVLGRAARERVRNRFDWDVLVETALGVYG